MSGIFALRVLRHSIDVQGITLEEIIADTVAKVKTYKAMMNWYEETE